MKTDVKTVQEWLHWWVDYEVAPAVKASSFQTYLNQANNHIIPALGHICLAGITFKSIIAFTDAPKRKKLSASIIKRFIRLLSSALKAAFEKNLLSANPCKRLRWKYYGCSRQRVLSLKEQEQLQKQHGKSAIYQFC